MLEFGIQIKTPAPAGMIVRVASGGTTLIGVPGHGTSSRSFTGSDEAILALPSDDEVEAAFKR